MTGPFDYHLQVLRDGAELTLYRGRKRDDSTTVLVIALAAEQPGTQNLRRLEHEFSLAGQLQPEWAATPLALRRLEGRTILVLEDRGGDPLDRILLREKDQPFDLGGLLRLAVGMATALGRVHQQGLIHKDIKPENVLADEAGRVWLTGFGIATRLPRERQDPASPEVIAGTLAYMSPEQTGRMNRSIDTRSDLYSLGVTLYQMLTGALPFTATEPLEWVHCHIARQPIAPVERRAMPESLSAITMRLLAKNAEERYQTAAGLEADLRHCLTEWQSHGRINSFALGAHDVSDQLFIAEKLYGREHEVATLLATFDRVVAGGRPELVLVSGYSGIGKSAVVNELHKSLVPPRGLLASGKFDQYKRDIPYGTVAQAFQSLIRPILSKPEAELSKWAEELRQALSPNGSLVIDLVPELKLVIGEQPPVSALPARDSKLRSHLAFRRFIGVFARREHPLALFLDDLQWLDAATLDFLEDLLVQQDLAHLLVVGAYRDNEVDPAHPLMRKLSAIRQAGATVQEICLTPLSSADLAHLIADALHSDPQRATPLARLIHDKTDGNPFFSIQFISALVEEGLIAFDHKHARWRWDLDAIRGKAHTDNIVDLMVSKLNRLPLTTQKALQQLACIGNRAEAVTLAVVYEKSEDETEADLWEALQQGLIIHSADSYRFVHDRVQEAAYSLLSEEARPGFHLRIGRLLHGHVPAEKREESIFEIVNQLNRGADLITLEDERYQLAELNLMAGKRAKASTAYASALKYFTACEAVLPNNSWECRHDLVFHLQLNRAECEFLTGELAVAAERVEMLRFHALNTVELAMATCVGMDVYFTFSQVDRAVAIGLEYLHRVAVDLPTNPTDEQVRTGYERILKQAGVRTVEEMIDFPLMSDPTSIATMDVLTKLAVPSWYTNRNLHALLIFEAVGLSIEHGNIDASCDTYLWISLTAWPRFGDYKNAFRFGQLGYELVERRGLKRFQAATYDAFGAGVMPWMKHLSACCSVMRQAFDVANQIGDLTYAAWSRFCLNTLFFATGSSLVEVHNEAEFGLRFVQGAKFEQVVDQIRPHLGLIRTLRGLTTTFGSFDHAEFDEMAFERHLETHPAPGAAFCYWIRRLQAHFYAGDYNSAVDSSLRARPLLAMSPTFELVEYEFYGALARSAAWSASGESEKRDHFDALEAHSKQLDLWAELCPENFEDRAALVAAEIARIDGRELDAERLYEQAIRSARANGFVHNEAIVYEVAAQFYAGRGFATFADAYLRNAWSCYDRWGAPGKVRQLEALYPQLSAQMLRTQAPSSHVTATIDAPVAQFDAETVVKAFQALSSEINLPGLIEKLMRLAIENAGAERGLLILVYDDGPRIEAEAKARPENVEILIRHESITPVDLPPSVLQFVLRTQQRVLIDDASTPQPEFGDDYLRGQRPRSILCLPIVKQMKAIGALYLENNLTSGAFTSSRVAVLDVLASQAAISLENARLYSDLQRSEAFMAQGQKISKTASFGWSVASGETYWSEEIYNIFEYDRSARGTVDMVFQRIHPEDQEFARQSLDEAVREEKDFDIEHRLLMPDGRVKHVHRMGRALKTGGLDYVGAVTDITAAKQADEKIRQSESELRQTLEFAPQHVYVLGPDAGGSRFYVNQVALDYLGLTFEQWRTADQSKLFHPGDWARTTSETQAKLSGALPHESEVRLPRSDGTYRWFLLRWNPLRDEHGRLSRWYVAGTDIEELKLSEQRLQDENVSLREEIDKASMFEEIVGTSAPLREVLSRISKVGPTDSTVLITGETGTGKELVARAIHRHSQRSAYSFVSINCAATPRDLIASELFGHEKGAFTGATELRRGRFELAAGGTLFLDEVGELPAETQVVLLRVLQEREFERVGGAGLVRVDVRVIAATNRDLEEDIQAGTFRSDLFYRLNVFPIEVPKLCERREDIPLLVEYFLDRYGRKAGKSFKTVDKRSLDLLQSYPWPGNIRELQNVIERSVIVSETATFSVDESWLSRKSPAPLPGIGGELVRTPPSEEKSIIEAALRKCGGRVYGPGGAAEHLGLPRSTVESKIRALKINKNRFKHTGPPRND